jgi:hypothetical protein
MDSDIDYDSDKDQDYDSTNTHTDTFREALSRWKQNQVDSILGENQDTIILNTYLKKARTLYSMFHDYIELGKPLVEDNNIQELVSSLPSEMDMDTRITILHYLFRDLVEFPFTYDTVYTNSLKTEEALNTNILSNK